MSHFAQVKNGIVQQVIVAEQDFIDTLPDSSDWVQTSYNTIGGAHANGGTPLRKNFAGIGYTYDGERDAFIAPKPYASWILNEQTCQWQAPVQMPDVEKEYRWDEATITWVALFEGTQA